MLTVHRVKVRWPFYWLGTLYLKLFKWTVVGDVPSDPKWVAIVAHHTSNWDFPTLLAASFYFRIHAYWIGKHTLFRGPFGWILRRIGGIPIDRQSRHDSVEQVVQAFNEQDKLVLGIAPEGTRKRTMHWKSGFYHIAYGAGVPIVLVFIDYKRRSAGIGPTVIPTGDLDEDMRKIREFYSHVVPKYPEKRGEIRVAPGADRPG